MAALNSETLKDRFKSVSLATTITFKGVVVQVKSFFCDDLSQVNKSRGTDYPLFLMKPMDSRKPDKHAPYEIYKFDYFIFELEGQKDADERMTSWAKMKGLSEQFLADLENSTPDPDTNPQDIHILGEVVYENGHHMEHADRLIGVRTTGEIRVYDGKCN